MKLSKFATASVALLAAGALVFGGSTAANAAYPPNAKLSVSGPSTGAAGATKTYVVRGNVTGSYSGESVVAAIGGRTYTKALSKSGTASLAIKLPSTAGKYTIKFKPSFGSTFTKSVTVGKAASISGLAAQKITKKSDKTSKITGKTADNASVVIRVSGPSGVKAVAKTVKANSSGKFSYTYSKASKKGTYKVTVTFVTSSKYYGTAVKSTSFKKTK